MDKHPPRPDGTCGCGAAGFWSRLSCGCWSWMHGGGRGGGYVSCGAKLAHQAAYKILEVRPGPARPATEAGHARA